MFQLHADMAPDVSLAFFRDAPAPLRLRATAPGTNRMRDRGPMVNVVPQSVQIFLYCAVRGARPLLVQV